MFDWTVLNMQQASRSRERSDRPQIQLEGQDGGRDKDASRNASSRQAGMQDPGSGRVYSGRQEGGAAFMGQQGQEQYASRGGGGHRSRSREQGADYDRARS